MNCVNLSPLLIETTNANKMNWPFSMKRASLLAFWWPYRVLPNLGWNNVPHMQESAWSHQHDPSKVNWLECQQSLGFNLGSCRMQCKALCLKESIFLHAMQFQPCIHYVVTAFKVQLVTQPEGTLLVSFFNKQNIPLRLVSCPRGRTSN